MLLRVQEWIEGEQQLAVNDEDGKMNGLAPKNERIFLHYLILNGFVTF